MFRPLYTISNRILSCLSQIAEIKALVAKSKLLPEREVLLRKTAVIKMAHSSTSIEGNRLREYQVEQVAEGKKIDAAEDQIQEIKNYLAALRVIDILSQSKKDFTIKDILDVHRLIVKGLIENKKAGVFRQRPVYVVNVLPDGQERLVYTPPAAKYVESLVEELIDWLSQHHDIHPVVKAGLFHYQFETIHPFPDGNGRCGRLLTLLYLYQSGWDFKKILVLEDYYNRNRKAYYQALQTGTTHKARQRADLTPWLEYFVEGFLDEARRVKDQILRLSVIGDIPGERNVLDRDELIIVDFVLTLGKITSTDVVDILKVPKRTAQAKLKRLEDIHVLQKKGAGPATVYVIPQHT